MYAGSIPAQASIARISHIRIDPWFAPQMIAASFAGISLCVEGLQARIQATGAVIQPIEAAAPTAAVVAIASR